MASFSERFAFLISAKDEASATFRRIGDTADKELGRVDKQLNTFGAKSSKIGGFAKGIGGGLLAGVGTGAALKVGSELLDLGQQMAVWQVKTDTVFANQAESVRAWADANNESFGLTENKLAGVAASFGDLLIPMGFTREQAADMSKDVVGLSGALSAWTGGQRSAAEVSMILAKSMLGERETLKELGIAILDADVKARIAAKGQSQLTGALMEQAKAVATQELIFEKSADAQKAWANGSMDAIKDVNKARAEWEATKEKAAEAFLPPATEGLGWAVSAANFVESAVEPWVGVAQDIDDALTGIGEDMRAPFGSMSNDVAKAVHEEAVALDRASVAANNNRRSVTGAADATKDLGDEADEAAEKIESFADKVEDAVDKTFDLGRAQRSVDESFADLSDTATEKANKRADAEERVADAIESSERRIRDAKQNLADAEEDLQKIASGDRTDARRRVRDAKQDIADAEKDGAEALSDARDAQHDVNDAAAEQRDLVEEIGEGVADVVTKMREEGATATEINRYISDQKQRLIEIQGQLGLNRQEVEKILYLWAQIAGMAGTPILPAFAGDLGRDVRSRLETNGGQIGAVTLNVFTADDPDAIARSVSRELMLLGGRR